MSIEGTSDNGREYYQEEGNYVDIEPPADLNESESSNTDFIPFNDEQLKDLWEYSAEEIYASDEISYDQSFALSQAVAPLNFEELMSGSNNVGSGDALDSDLPLQDNRALDILRSGTRSADSLVSSGDTEMEYTEGYSDKSTDPMTETIGATGMLIDGTSIVSSSTTRPAAGTFSFSPTTDRSTDLRFREINQHEDLELNEELKTTIVAADISTKASSIYSSGAFQPSSIGSALPFPIGLMSAIKAPVVVPEASKIPNNIFASFKFDSTAFGFAAPDKKANPTPSNSAPVFSFGTDSSGGVGSSTFSEPESSFNASAGTAPKKVEEVVSGICTSATPGEDRDLAAICATYQVTNNSLSAPLIAVSSVMKDVGSALDSNRIADNHTSDSDLVTSTSVSRKNEEEWPVQTNSSADAGNPLLISDLSLAIEALKQQVSELETSLKTEKESSSSTIDALKKQVSGLETSLETEREDFIAACKDHKEKIDELEGTTRQQVAKHRKEKLAAESALTPLRNEAHLLRIKLSQVENEFEKGVQKRVAELVKENKESKVTRPSQSYSNLADTEEELATEIAKLAESLKREKKLERANHDLALAATMALRGNDAYPELDKMAAVAEEKILKSIAKRVVEELTDYGPASLLFEAAVMIAVEADVEERFAELEQRHSILSQQAIADGVRAEIEKKTVEWNATFATAVENQVKKDITEKYLPQMQQSWKAEMAKSGSGILALSIFEGAEAHQTFKDYMRPNPISTELEGEINESPKTPRLNDEGAGALSYESQSQLDDPLGIYFASPPRMSRVSATSQDPSGKLHVDMPFKPENHPENYRHNPKDHGYDHSVKPTQDVPNTGTTNLKPEDHTVEPLHSEIVLVPDNVLVEGQASTKIRACVASRGVGNWRSWLGTLVGAILSIEYWYLTLTTYIPDPAIDLVIEFAASSLSSIPGQRTPILYSPSLLDISAEWTMINNLLAWCPETDSPTSITASTTCPMSHSSYHHNRSPFSRLRPRDSVSDIVLWCSLSADSNFDEGDPPSSPASPTFESLKYLCDKAARPSDALPAEDLAGDPTHSSTRLINNGIWSFIGLNVIRFVVTGGTLLGDVRDLTRR